MSDTGDYKLTNYAMLEDMLLYDPSLIEEMYSTERTEAFRTANNFSNKAVSTLPETEQIKLRYFLEKMYEPRINGDLTAVFGTLQTWDTFYIGLHDEVLTPFYNSPVTPYTTGFGKEFLEVIPFVKTMITNAGKDLVIYAPAIPSSFKAYTDVVNSVDETAESFTINYKNPVAGTDATKVEVYFPSYPESCHSVTMLDAPKFLNDTAEWLKK